jgi:hypothetical protein
MLGDLARPDWMDRSMKRFFFAALVAAASFTANAGVIATMRNDAGGFVKLSDNTSSTCTQPNGRFVVSTTNRGRAITGCYYYSGTGVLIHWDNGGGSSYFEIDDFKVTNYFNETYAN